jgi:FKBP-type peptidyl-prolyl cis-trans isomerase
MIRTIKTSTYFFILSLLFVIYSCTEENNVVERTADMEAAELQDILAKLTDSGYDIDTTASGIYYVVDEEGTGPTVKTGDTCYVEYAGYLPNGDLFATSGNDSEDGIIDFVYPYENIISGFNEGLTVMNKGSQIEMIIPSSKAYGETGTLYVPPYTTVIVIAKLNDLKPSQVE